MPKKCTEKALLDGLWAILPHTLYHPRIGRSEMILKKALANMTWIQIADDSNIYNIICIVDKIHNYIYISYIHFKL